MEGQSGRLANFIQTSRPYIAMIPLQFGYAGMNIITKVSLNRGMSQYVLVVYRHAFATVVIAPFALVLENKVRPKMTLAIFMQIFVLGLLGPVIDQNLYYVGLKFTLLTFSCAMSNMLPAMTFVMAVLFRMEKVDMKKVRCVAKVVGTLVTVGGAMLMTLCKGIPEPVKCTVRGGGNHNSQSILVISHDDIEAANNVNTFDSSEVTVAVTGPIPQLPMVAIKAPNPN